MCHDILRSLVIPSIKHTPMNQTSKPIPGAFGAGAAPAHVGKLHFFKTNVWYVGVEIGIDEKGCGCG